MNNLKITHTHWDLMNEKLAEALEQGAEQNMVRLLQSLTPEEYRRED